MKLRLPEETYQCPENTSFQERRVFKAENYLAKETLKTGGEFKETPEVLSFSQKADKKDESAGSSKIRKLVEKVTESSTLVASVSVSAVTVAVAAGVIGIVPGIGKAKTPFLWSQNEISNFSSPACLRLSIPISDYDPSVPFSAGLSFFNENGEKLADQPTEASVSENGDALLVEEPLAFGAHSYQLKIVPKEGEAFFTDVLLLSVDQSYQATFAEIPPQECELSYRSDGTFDLSFDTGFATDFPEVFSYRVSMVSEEGTLISAQQCSTSSVCFNQVSSYSPFHFEYERIGLFADGEHVYSSSFSEAVPGVPNPQFSMGEISFVDDAFVLDVSFSSNGAEDVSLSLECIQEDGSSSTQTFGNLAERENLLLKEFNLKPGRVVLKPTLEFTDKQSFPKRHLIALPEKTYDLAYSFLLKRLVVDVSDVSSSALALSFDFEYSLPSSFMISLTCDGGEPLLSPVERKIVLPEALPVSGGEVKIAVYDENGQEFMPLDSLDVIPLSEARALAPSTPYFYSPNPGESLVTFNEDGTINLYRPMQNPSVQPPSNAYYEASLFLEYGEDGEPLIDIENFSQDAFSKMENLPKADYRFFNSTLIEEGGILYRIDKTTPSGSLVFHSSEEIFDLSSHYDAENDQTVCVLKLKIYGDLNNAVLFQGKELPFKDYAAGSEVFSFTLEGDQRGQSVSLGYSAYSESFDAYSSTNEFKGSQYETFELTVQEEPTITE